MEESKEDLLEQKRICDERLAIKRAALQETRASARLKGRYMDPTRYSQLELDVKMLGQKSQAIQMKIGALKKNNEIYFNDCFRDAAAKVLPEDTFIVILELANDIKRARQR